MQYSYVMIDITEEKIVIKKRGEDELVTMDS